MAELTAFTLTLYNYRRVHDAYLLNRFFAAFDGAAIHASRQGLVPLDGRHVDFPDLVYSFCLLCRTAPDLFFHFVSSPFRFFSFLSLTRGAVAAH